MRRIWCEGTFAAQKWGAQLNTRFATKTRGSGRPLSPVRDRDEFKTDAPVPVIAPKAPFFIPGGEIMALCQQLELGPSSFTLIFHSLKVRLVGKFLLAGQKVFPLVI